MCDEAMRSLMKGNRNHERQDPDGDGVKGRVHRFCSGKLGLYLVEAITSRSKWRSGRRTFRILRQAVIQADPRDLLRNPDVFGWRKGVTVVKGCQGDAGRRAIAAPCKQPGTAPRAEDPIEPLR